MNETAKTKMKKSEIFWIVLSSVLGATGLFFIILGIVGDHLPKKLSENWILTSQTAFESAIHLTYRWFGIIFLLAGTLIIVLALNHYARKTDADDERALRRAQRLQVISSSAPVAEPAPEKKSDAVEVNSTPVNPSAK